MATRKEVVGGVTRYLSDNPVPPKKVDGAAATTATERAPMKISAQLRALSREVKHRGSEAVDVSRLFQPAEHPPGFRPTSNEDQMAMDEALAWAATGGSSYDQNFTGNLLASMVLEGQTFLGYPYLATLTQRPEYRRMAERLATEMTRKWIRLKATGEKDLTDEIKQLSDEMDRLNVKDLFRQGAEVDLYMGRSHLFMDLGQTGGELENPIGDGDDKTSESKIAKRSLKRLKLVEPMWSYPMNYSSMDPLADDFYNPQSWLVASQRVHASRFLTFVGRPVPDLLKPAYSFGGLSLSQMAKPYVENWLRTRQSVTDLIESFSVSGLATDIGSAITGGSGEDLFARVDLFNATRSNRGTMIIDKATEEFFNVSTPIGGLSELQGQALEQLSVVGGIPLSILVMVTPKGLNASSDGEIRIFYDLTNAAQEVYFGPHLRRLLRIVQRSLWGKVIPEITFEFVPLWTMSEKEEAEVEKVRAETASTRIADGIISPAEERQRVAAEDQTPYPGLDPDDVPEASEEEAGDLAGITAENDNNPDDEEGGARDRRLAADASTPRTLYVRRDARPETQRAIRAWAKKQGIECNVDDMHVTVLYSRTPVDWLKVGDGFGFSAGTDAGITIKPGGPRVVEQFGNHIVIAFANSDLQYRHMSAMEQVDGISWDHPDYTPHISIAKISGKANLKGVVPYAGPIELGPEVFEEVKDDASRPFATDADFREGEHPRAPDGKFGAAGRGGKATPAKAGGKEPGTERAAERAASAAPAPRSIEAEPLPVERMRDYEPKELDWEYEVEYLKYSKAAFPDAFSSREDFEEKLDAAPLVHLTDDQMRTLGNSMAYSGKGRGEEWVHKTFSHRRDSARIVDALREGETAPPIILKSGGKLRLMAGQTRLATGLALGINVPAKVIDVSRKAQDEAPFDESKHPRDHGKFASKPGSSGSSTEGGGETKTFASKKDHVAHLLTKGTTTEEILKATGWPSVSVPAQAAAAGMKLTKTLKGGKTIYHGTPMTDAEKAQVKALAAIAKAAKAGKTVASSSAAATSAEPLGQGFSWQESTAAIDKFKANTKGKTLGAIESAKEKVKATVETGGSVDTAKAILNPAEQEAVAADFHKTVESMFNSSKKHFDAGKTAEHQKEAVKKLQTVKAAEAVAQAEAFKVSLDTPEAKAHYEAIEGILGGVAKDKIKFAQSKLEAAGLAGKISAPEAAQIIAYSEHTYAEVNKQLRSGVMTEQQFKYARALNAALDKLPPHEGVTVRGAQLSPEQLAMCKPGMIVEERGFTSTSTGKGFGGNVRYEVHGKSGRNIRKLSSHPGEAEVLFKAGTRFRVKSKTGSTIVLEEVKYAL